MNFGAKRRKSKGFRAEGFGFRVLGFGFEIQGLQFMFRVYGLGPLLDEGRPRQNDDAHPNPKPKNPKP